MFKIVYKKMLITIFFSISSYACAGEYQNKCDGNSVISQTNCIKKENLSLQSQLNLQNNKKQNDYSKWLGDLKIKCEGKVNYSSGGGVGLIKEQCYNDEYKNRIKYLNDKIKQKQKNSDGLEITNLPYNSQDHVNCLLKNNKKSCGKINLINITELSEVYNFIDESNGASVIFPETESGVILIASPSSSDSGGVLINLISINTLGLIKQVSLDASKNVLISNNYEISYIKNGKLLKINLNKNGEFVSK
ncbi:hypothetical protein [Acinetobacter rongchengensis]|uniref:Uncharacterized protein n=1 Tax=Acinetobacter rongchengensis TaxID=2419601 RepID=A0A3A8EWW3_9GAMM|nr:hypothetical protein [Acinetobacter rongchengensis]RKG37936.1 hypothetical protein D7V20_09305 [Acinetobacter rongchengensis]